MEKLKKKKTNSYSIHGVQFKSWCVLKKTERIKFHVAQKRFFAVYKIYWLFLFRRWF